VAAKWTKTGQKPGRTAHLRPNGQLLEAMATLLIQGTRSTPTKPLSRWSIVGLIQRPERHITWIRGPTCTPPTVKPVTTVNYRHQEAIQSVHDEGGARWQRSLADRPRTCRSAGHRPRTRRCFSGGCMLS
jgi:hypothetical protein